jgi:RNA polymerase sigma factor (sigma-70 family)
LYIENLQVEVVNNEELFLELQNTEDEDVKAELTDKILRNNLRTIHNVIYKRYGSRLAEILQRNRMTYGDLFSIGIELMMKAINKFDLDMGYKFSTLSYTVLHNGYSKYFQRLKTPDSNLSTETPLHTSKSDASEVTLLDTLALESDDNIEKQISEVSFYIALFEELEKKYKPRDMAIIRASLSGQYTQTQIGAKFGITQVQVSRIIRKIQKTARELRDNEVV